jgi:cellulose biosynthesis protein BcsQ
MRIKLLIATTDTDYAEYLSNSISEYHESKIEVSVCKVSEGLQEMLANKRYDVALLDSSLLGNVGEASIRLPLLLWSEDESADNIAEDVGIINKYQRISSIVTAVLERYAKVSGSRSGPDSSSAIITAVWSPAGGVGKTTVALAYAASKAAEGRNVLYLDLELFSSIPAYFNHKGKSISAVFEMLESHEGNVRMLIQGIRCQESGISFLCGPDNFDDMYALSSENTIELINACMGLTDELVVDLSCVCDMQTRQIMALADKILLVTDPTSAAQAKLSQFVQQHNVFESIQEKITLIANKGVVINAPPVSSIISFPFIQSSGASALYSTLSAKLGTAL